MDLSKEKDNLYIYVKKDKKELIEKCYKSLGWQKVAEQENEKYEDTINLNYSRPHQIKNKDALQLLQVYVEADLNEIGKIEKYKHTKTLSLGFTVGVLSAALLFIGILYLFYVKELSSIILCAGLISLGVLCGIFTIINCRKLFKKENELFNKKLKSLNNSINDICEQSNKLLNN